MDNNKQNFDDQVNSKVDSSEIYPEDLSNDSKNVEPTPNQAQASQDLSSESVAGGQKDQTEQESQQAPANEPVKNEKVADVVTDVLSTFKMWFSKNPLDVFNRKIEFNSALALFGVHFIVAFLSIIILIGRIPDISFGFIDTYKLILPFIFIIPFSFFVFSAGIMVDAIVLKNPDSTLKSSMELVAIAYLPCTVINFVGMILGLINFFLASFLLGISAIVFTQAIYKGFELYLGKPKKSHFWTLPISYIAISIVNMLFCMLVMAIFIGSQMSYLY